MRFRYAILLSCSLLASIVAGAQTVPSYVPLAGLAAWYPFTRNAVDSSGNNNNGTVFGAALTTDRFGTQFRAYSFNGTSDYIRISTNSASTLNIKASFTLSAWFKVNWQTATHDMQIFWRGDPAPGADPYLLYLSNSNIVFRRDVNTGSTSNTVSYALAGSDTGSWHHAVGTYDTLTDLMTIYLDGVNVTRAAATGTIIYSTNNYYNNIGAVDIGNQQNLKGSIDDIGVWTRALTDCEVTQLYNASALLISSQPVNTTAGAGGGAVFSINDLSSYATYQWAVDSGSGFMNLPNAAPYYGTTTKSLTIMPVTPKMNGYQYRCTRNGGGCVETSSSAKLTISTTGVGTTAQLRGGFVLYPNPNTGRFTLSNNSSLAVQDVLVSVVDMTGRTVCKQQYNLSHNEAQLDYHSKLAPGAYLLRINGGSQQQTLMFSVTE